MESILQIFASYPEFVLLYLSVSALGLNKNDSRRSCEVEEL